MTHVFETRPERSRKTIKNGNTRYLTEFDLLRERAATSREHSALSVQKLLLLLRPRLIRVIYPSSLGWFWLKVRFALHACT